MQLNHAYYSLCFPLLIFIKMLIPFIKKFLLQIHMMHSNIFKSRCDTAESVSFPMYLKIFIHSNGDEGKHYDETP